MWITEFDKEQEVIEEIHIAEGCLMDRGAKKRTHSGPLQIVPRPLLKLPDRKWHYRKQRAFDRIHRQTWQRLKVWMQPGRLYSVKELKTYLGRIRHPHTVLGRLWHEKKLVKYARGEWYRAKSNPRRRSYFGVHYMLAEKENEIPVYTIEQIARHIPSSGNTTWNVANFTAMYCYAQSVGPSLSDIVQGIEFIDKSVARSSIHNHIDKLEDSGFLVADRNTGRRQTGKFKIRELEEGRKGEFLALVKSVLIRYRTSEGMNADQFIEACWRAWCIPEESLPEDGDTLNLWTVEVAAKEPEWYSREWVKYKTGDV